MSRSPSTAASSFWRFPAGRRRQRSGRQQSDASPCPPGAARRFQARGSRQGLLRGGPETQQGPPHGVGGAGKSLGRAVSPLPSAVTRMTAGVRLRPSQVPGEPSGLGSLSGWHRAGGRLVLEPGRNPALRQLPAPPLCGDSPRSTWGNTRSGSDGPGQSRVFCVSPCAGTRARHGHLGMKRPRVYRAHTTREGRGAVCERLSSQGCGAAAGGGGGAGSCGSQGGGPAEGGGASCAQGGAAQEALGVRCVLDDLLPDGEAGPQAAAGPAGRAGHAEGFGHRRQSAAGEHEAPTRGAQAHVHVRGRLAPSVAGPWGPADAGGEGSGMGSGSAGGEVEDRELTGLGH